MLIFFVVVETGNVLLCKQDWYQFGIQFILHLPKFITTWVRAVSGKNSRLPLFHHGDKWCSTSGSILSGPACAKLWPNDGRFIPLVAKVQRNASVLYVWTSIPGKCWTQTKIINVRQGQIITMLYITFRLNICHLCRLVTNSCWVAVVFRLLACSGVHLHTFTTILLPSIHVRLASDS